MSFSVPYNYDLQQVPITVPPVPAGERQDSGGTWLVEPERHALSEGHAANFTCDEPWPVSAPHDGTMSGGAVF